MPKFIVNLSVDVEYVLDAEDEAEAEENASEEMQGRVMGANAAVMDVIINEVREEADA
jgi:hypothetical protein